MPPESRFLEALKSRVLVFDGAMGTMIQTYHLTKDDFGGRQGANDYLVLTRPDVIREIHAKYLEAGADVVETCTFQSTRPRLEEWGLGDNVAEINIRAAEIARAEADRFSTPDRPRFVAGSMGPTGFLPSSSDPSLSNITFDQLEEIFREQAEALARGGVDTFLIETSQDILEVKAAIAGCDRFRRESGRSDIPIMAQITLDPSGRMLLGTDAATALAILEELPIAVIGMNCSTGPHEMRESVRYLGENSSLPVSVIPNAGMPENIDGEAHYGLKPDALAHELRDFVGKHGISIVGGCCGTTPEHIRALSDSVRGLTPGKRPRFHLHVVASPIKPLRLDIDNPPVVVGERLNAQGSRKAKEMMLAKDIDALVTLGKEQVDDGAHMLDICTAMTEAPLEKELMLELARRLSQETDAPLMIDSTEADVIEAALKVIPGRVIVNSINLEGDGSRVRKIAPLIRKFGAVTVAMTIDDSDPEVRGMAKTAAHKLQVARKITDICTREYNLDRDQLVFDVLTFTLATGEAEFRRSATETIEGIRAVKKELPGVFTVLGVSNVSFGLTPPARRVLNSVFLYHCVQAGLDLAIVNAKEIIPYAEIPRDARDIAEDLVFDRADDALPRFIKHFEGAAGAPASDPRKAKIDPSLPVEQRIHEHILKRVKEGVIEALEEARTQKGYSPVDIINKILLPAMKDVGDRMATGEIILPFVLQSAEVMKRAVSHLEQFLDKDQSVTKGNVVLATVYGDVHDIGKNLVKTIWSNNGYTVHDLGKQVPLNTILAKAQEVGAVAIGLSALLVTTSKQMRFCVEELEKMGLPFVLIVGGAAINREYVARISITDGESPYRNGVFYSKDAFEGLRHLNAVADPEARVSYIGDNVRDNQQRYFQSLKRATSAKAHVGSAGKTSSIRRDAPVPIPPFWGSRVLGEIPLAEVFPLIDRKALFGHSWGVLKRKRSQEEYDRDIRETFEPLLRDLQDRAIREKILLPKAVYGFFPVWSDGESLVIFDPVVPTRELGRFSFPRQPEGDHLCLADYFSPKDRGQKDVLALDVVTVGDRVSEICKEYDAKGDYSMSLYLHGLGVQTAEAMAEWVHQRVKADLGIPGGQRYSFGYPACPDLTQQGLLFKLLGAEQAIGTVLTEGFQIVPEASTAAFIAHHPEAKYFSVRDGVE
ncbi:MAG: methionine synthase [Deltaproteobacteria bacterium]|nr:methionine synthase [Deltaproteobacteria bacterium]